MSSHYRLVGLKQCIGLLKMLCTKWNKSGGEIILAARFVCKNKKEGHPASLFLIWHPMSNVWHLTSHRACHLAGAQAARAGIHPARGTVHDCLDTLDVGLPSPVGAPVGMGNLNTKRHIFAAKFTFRHVSHLLFTRQIQNNETILAGLADKCKQFLTFCWKMEIFQINAYNFI